MFRAVFLGLFFYVCCFTAGLWDEEALLNVICISGMLRPHNAKSGYLNYPRLTSFNNKYLALSYRHSRQT